MMETCEVVTRGRKLTKEDFRVARRAEGFEPTFSTPQIDTLTIKLCSRSIFIFFFFHSLTVKHTAHNGCNVGSIPAGPTPLLFVLGLFKNLFLI